MVKQVGEHAEVDTFPGCNLLKAGQDVFIIEGESSRGLMEGKRVGEKFQTFLAAELESLSKFREFIKSICQRYPQVNAEHCYDLQLAVDEACTNIIQHGYAGMDPGSMILALEVGRESGQYHPH